MMAQPYLHNTSRSSGTAAEVAADKKTTEYAPLAQTYVFVPIAVETVGAISSDGLEFLGDLGRRITQVTDDICESAFLFQRLSGLIQRYNVVAIQGTFAHTTSEEEF